MKCARTALLLAGCLCVHAGLADLSSVAAHQEVVQQIAAIDELLDKDPRNTELLLRRGELHRVHRDWAAAEADFLAAREIDPKLDAVDYLLGKLRFEAGDPKAALARLDRYLSKHPNHVGALVARARVRAAVGQPMKAAQDYTLAIDAHGENRPLPAYYLERARALADAGPRQLERAVRGLDEGLAKLGQPVTLQLYAIDLELSRGRHDAALERLDDLMSTARRKETWLVRRGEILEEAGRREPARTAYVDALAAIETLPPARRGTRAVSRLREQANTAIARLDEVQ